MSLGKLASDWTTTTIDWDALDTSAILRVSLVEGRDDLAPVTEADQLLAHIQKLLKREDIHKYTSTREQRAFWKNYQRLQIYHISLSEGTAEVLPHAVSKTFAEFMKTSLFIRPLTHQSLQIAVIQMELDELYLNERGLSRKKLSRAFFPYIKALRVLASEESLAVPILYCLLNAIDNTELSALCHFLSIEMIYSHQFLLLLSEMGGAAEVEELKLAHLEFLFTTCYLSSKSFKNQQRALKVISQVLGQPQLQGMQGFFSENKMVLFTVLKRICGSSSPELDLSKITASNLKQLLACGFELNTEEIAQLEALAGKGSFDQQIETVTKQMLLSESPEIAFDLGYSAFSVFLESIPGTGCEDVFVKFLCELISNATVEQKAALMKVLIKSYAQIGGSFILEVLVKMNGLPFDEEDLELFTSVDIQGLTYKEQYLHLACLLSVVGDQFDAAQYCVVNYRDSSITDAPKLNHDAMNEAILEKAPELFVDDSSRPLLHDLIPLAQMNYLMYLNNRYLSNTLDAETFVIYLNKYLLHENLELRERVELILVSLLKPFGLKGFEFLVGLLMKNKDFLESLPAYYSVMEQMIGTCTTGAAVMLSDMITNWVRFAEKRNIDAVLEGKSLIKLMKLCGTRELDLLYNKFALEKSSIPLINSLIS